jgi:hypothetical protein
MEFKAQVLALLRNVHFAQKRPFVKPTSDIDLNLAQAYQKIENQKSHKTEKKFQKKIFYKVHWPKK